MIHYVAKSIRYPISTLRKENEHSDWFLISPDKAIYELDNIIEGSDHVPSSFSNVYLAELIVFETSKY